MSLAAMKSSNAGYVSIDGQKKINNTKNDENNEDKAVENNETEEKENNENTVNNLLTFQIFVRYIVDGQYRLMTLSINRHQTIGDILRNQICAKIGTPFEMCQLVIPGRHKPLDNALRVCDHVFIVRQTTLHLVIRRGRVSLDSRYVELLRLHAKFGDICYEANAVALMLEKFIQELKSCADLISLKNTFQQIQAAVDSNASFHPQSYILRAVSRQSCRDAIQLIRAHCKKKCVVSAMADNIEKDMQQQESKNENHPANAKDVLEATFETRVAALEEKCAEWDTNQLIQWLNIIEYGKFCCHSSSSSYQSLANTILRYKVDGHGISSLNDFFLDVAEIHEPNDRKLLLQNFNRLSMKMNSQNGDKCMVCAEAKINTVMYPCGHQSFCFACLSTRNLTKCPICRQSIKEIAQTYMAGFN